MVGDAGSGRPRPHFRLKSLQQTKRTRSSTLTSHTRFSCGGCCGGLIGINSLLYPQPSASEQYFVTPFFVVFSSRNGLAHCGHFSLIGLSQKTVSHFG